MTLNLLAFFDIIPRGTYDCRRHSAGFSTSNNSSCNRWQLTRELRPSNSHLSTLLRPSLQNSLSSVVLLNRCSRSIPVPKTLNRIWFLYSLCCVFSFFEPHQQTTTTDDTQHSQHSQGSFVFAYKTSHVPFPGEETRHQRVRQSPCHSRPHQEKGFPAI